MATKFSEFLQSKNIDRRRLLVASKKLEQLRPEDRELKRTSKKADAKKADAKKEDGDAPAKPRSGRPVTPVLLDKIEAGKAVSGPAKTRVLRAVNAVLEQKKQDPVDLRALF